MLLKFQYTIVKLLGSFTAVLFSIAVCAQYSYIGRVVNTINGAPLDSTVVQIKHGEQQTQTDKNGALLWKFGEHTENIKYRIVNNIFYSPENENIALQLFNFNGQKQIETGKLGNGGTYLFPDLKNGMYILNIVSREQSSAFKIISSNYKISLFQKPQAHLNQSQSQSRDTLLFSKSGFYDQEITLPKNDTSFVINLFPNNQANFNYLLTIPNYEVFSDLQSSPFITNQGEVESVKFIYDENKNQVYFMNTKRHDWHFSFAKDFLGYTKGHQHFNATQYTNSHERYLYPGSINFYKNSNRYILRFYAGDAMYCSKIKEIHARISSLSYLGNKLFLYANNTEWHNCSDVPQVTSEELFEGQNYQGLNFEKGFGYLKKVDVENLPTTYVGKHDIILLNGIPNDVSVVAGIITTEFQTPLSHINILSHNRKTPNMALRDGWTNTKLDTLLGELVYFEVLADSFVIHKASLQAATSFWNNNEPQITLVLDKDESVSGIVNLASAGINSVNYIGGKAANFAELLKIQNPQIPTPENPFTIPFYYYSQHIQTNQIDNFIEQILNDENFKTSQEYRKNKLDELREIIKNTPIDTQLLELVKKQINGFKEFKAFRFRSSTNAEDLEFFSGAGLYDSFSAKKDHTTKTIENAIKKVWASLWNFRAFEEREFYKIDHRSVSMGILCHRSFPSEDANGVVITKNLYNINPGFIINAQFKEHSIVFPEAGVLHDQIILFTYSIDQASNFTIEYLSHSNIPEFEGQNVLTNSELYQLGEFCTQIKQHYFNNIPHNCNCLYKDFGLDIEFKIDSPNGLRKLYIKQVRIYN